MRSSEKNIDMIPSKQEERAEVGMYEELQAVTKTRTNMIWLAAQV